MQTERELVASFFKAKQAAYASPMTIRGWQAAGREDFLLLDVRKANPRPTQQIPNSLWIPEDALEGRLHELPKDKLLVLYCWDTWCSLATAAAVTLIAQGFTAKELYGGIAAWNALRLPVVTVAEPEAPSKLPDCAC